MLRTILLLAALSLATSAAAAAPALQRPTLRRAFEQIGSGGDTKAVALEDGAAAWAARWAALAGASRSIDSSYFIVKNDVFGLAFIAHLYVRAAEGVEVKLLLDGRGSGPLALPFMGLDELQELVGTGNADVRIYNPPLRQVARTIIYRSAVPISAGAHAKILIIDDELAITGGRNLAGPYFTEHGELESTIVDTDVLLTGGAPIAALADALRQEFQRSVRDRVRRDALNLDRRDELLRMIFFAMDAWLRGAIPDVSPAETAVLLEAAALAKLDRLPENMTRDEARPFLRQLARARSLRGALVPPLPPAARATVVEARIAAGTGRAEQPPDDTANDAIVRAIAAARHRIWIQSPYFMLTPRLFAALTRASKRGVEVVALTNGPDSSDNEYAQALFIDTWPELELRMPTLRVFVGVGDMLHTKRVIIDDVLVLVGSHNLDPLSAHLNTEVVVALWSRAMNQDAAARFTAALEGGEVLEYRIRRVAGRVTRDGNGRVVESFGPAHHLPERRLAELRRLKAMLFSIRGIWDFDFVAW